MGQVEGFVEVDVEETASALREGLTGDVVFDKGIDAVCITGMADVDDHAEAIGADVIYGVYVGLEGLAGLVFGGEPDVQVFGGVQEFGDGFFTVVLISEVGDVDGGPHFGGKADGGKRFFDNAFADGFVGIVIREFEGAVDRYDRDAVVFAGLLEFGDLDPVVDFQRSGNRGEFDACDVGFAKLGDVAFSEPEVLKNSGGDAQAG